MDVSSNCEYKELLIIVWYVKMRGREHAPSLFAQLIGEILQISAVQTSHTIMLPTDLLSHLFLDNEYNIYYGIFTLLV